MQNTIMQSSFKLLPFAVAVLYLSKICPGIGHSVTVQLQYSSPPTSYECFGGDAGLTDTSIMLQYIMVIEDDAVHPSSSEATTTQDEWTTVAALEPLNVSLHGQVSANFSVDSSVEGLQFRLLQLEHGGGSCNCWTLKSMAVTLDNHTEALVGEGDICFTTWNILLWWGRQGEGKHHSSVVLPWEQWQHLCQPQQRPDLQSGTFSVG